MLYSQSNLEENSPEMAQNRAIALVLAERSKQDECFGSMPRNRKPIVYDLIMGEEKGEVSRAILEGDSENYLTELVQLAATAVAAIEEYFTGLPLYGVEDTCKPISYSTQNALQAERQEQG